MPFADEQLQAKIAEGHALAVTLDDRPQAAYRVFLAQIQALRARGRSVDMLMSALTVTQQYVRDVDNGRLDTRLAEYQAYIKALDERLPRTAATRTENRVLINSMYALSWTLFLASLLTLLIAPTMSIGLAIGFAVAVGLIIFLRQTARDLDTERQNLETEDTCARRTGASLHELAGHMFFFVRAKEEEGTELDATLTAAFPIANARG